ncbi:MAG TPA: alpha/beta fold hydrolase [Candidatus Acidoferrales bacterium]|nr:alpha/beta fold hydrolase [Candidatus Acidoferrales bacterium]
MIAATFAAVLAAASASPASSPAPWFAPPTTRVAAQAVTFTNQGATLHGTLYVPDVGHPVPAIVVFHGASEPLASTLLYRHLSEGLPQIGIAVLLFDRRGAGKSTGNPDVPYQTLANDGIAGAAAIRQLPQIDPQRVGYWGISQGGWLATIAASSDSRAAFAVAVSAPLVPAETQMEFAMSNRLDVLGYSSKDVAAMLEARYQVDGYFNGRNSRAQAVAALDKIENRPWFDLMYLPTAAELPKNPANSSWRGQMDLDSFAAVERVRIPILFLLGSEDPWIPVAATVARLRTVAATHPHLAFDVVPGANHLMMMPPAHELMNDAEPAQIAAEAPQSPAYFMLLASWLERIVTPR